MTVILNESALALLLDSQEGPVGRFVQRRAERVAAQMRLNVAAYFATAPTLHVEDDVGLQMQGSSAIVGLRPDSNPHDGESKGQIFARREREGTIRVGLAASLSALGAD